jgi:hypothetical protein
MAPLNIGRSFPAQALISTDSSVDVIAWYRAQQTVEIDHPLLTFASVRFRELQLGLLLRCSGHQAIGHEFVFRTALASGHWALFGASPKKQPTSQPDQSISSVLSNRR